MIKQSGPYIATPYDASGATLPEIAIRDAGDLAASWKSAVSELPNDARSFVLRDRDGARVRVGMVPVEPLTDDADTTSMCLSLDGTFLATGHADGNVRLWNATDGTLLWTRSPADEAIVGIAQLDQGPFVLAWCDDGPLLVFERKSGELTSRIDDPQNGPFVIAVPRECDEVALTGPSVTRFGLSEAGTRATLDADGANSGQDETDDESQPARDAGVQWIAYLSDSTQLIGARAGDDTDVIIFWDGASGKRIATIDRMRGIAACDLSPNRKLAAVGLVDERVMLVLIDTGLRSVIREVPLSLDGMVDLRFSSDGRSVLIHDVEHGIVIVDVETGTASEPLKTSDTGDLTIVKAGREIDDSAESTPMMVTRDSQGQLEITGLYQRGPFQPSGRSIDAAAKRFAIIDERIGAHFVTVFDLESREPLATLEHNGDVQEMWFSADGGLLAVRAAGHVTTWRLPRGV